jgi:hypothetical protein
MLPFAIIAHLFKFYLSGNVKSIEMSKVLSVPPRQVTLMINMLDRPIYIFNCSREYLKFCPCKVMYEMFVILSCKNCRLGNYILFYFCK